MAASAAIFLFALRERNLTKFDVVAVRRQQWERQ